MQLTMSGDYAVRVIVDLAAQLAGSSVRMRDLRRRTDVPRAYLSKIVQALARGALVCTRRGKHGGVSLLGDPRTITLKRVIEAVEGPIHLNRCLVRPGMCPRDTFCPVHPAWARIQQILVRELESVRISDLLNASPAVSSAGTREGPSC